MRRAYLLCAGVAAVTLAAQQGCGAPAASNASASAAATGGGGSSGKGGGGGGARGDGGSGGEGGHDPCDAFGVSKGPWVQHIDDASARIRWEACRKGTDESVAFAPVSGGAAETKTGSESKYVVTTTYQALLNRDATPDYAGTYWLHEVDLSGLQASTCYDYHIGDEPQRGGQFCTGHPTGTPFRFLAIGDTNVGLNASTKDILTHVLPMKPEFTVHGGDLEYYDSQLDTWNLFFQIMQPLLSQGAFYPAIGNHEDENPSEYDQYSLTYFGDAGFTGDSTHYTFETGGVHFFCLDTQESIYPGELQGTWLTQQLAIAAASPGFRFSIVYFHKPLVTCGDTSDDPTGRSLLEPLFIQYNVPLVLQAHMHGYERFDFGDITYVTTAGGGGLIGDVDANTSRPYCDQRVASGPYFHGLVLSVDASGISGQAVDADGSIDDSFSIAVTAPDAGPAPP